VCDLGAEFPLGNLDFKKKKNHSFASLKHGAPFPLFSYTYEFGGKVLHFCKCKIMVINTVGSKFLIHLALFVVMSHPKPYFQTLNTHVGAGPILVEHYYKTSTDFFFFP